MIVSDVKTMKAYVATIAGDDFNVFKPYVESATDWLIDEITGEKLYTVVCEKSDDDKRLLRLCERLITLNAYERAIPFLDLVQTNNGFGVTSSNGLVPASRERVNALIAATKTEQDAAVEALQAFLEVNDQYHEDWKISPSYSLLTDTLIHSLKVFIRYASQTVEKYTLLS